MLGGSWGYVPPVDPALASHAPWAVNHTGEVSCLEYTSDGRFLVAGRREMHDALASTGKGPSRLSTSPREKKSSPNGKSNGSIRFR